jgi:calcium binding protein 39
LGVFQSQQKMSFLFKSKPKSPNDLVKLTRESIQKLDAQNDGKKNNEEISKNLVAMKNILYGDGGISL